ncbi:MAG: hypothetical protein B7X37_05970, partial [Halothiobacillus sp. 14-55-98]
MDTILNQITHAMALGSISTRDFLFAYAFYYPLIMAWMWIIGGLWYFLRWENRYDLGPDYPPQIANQPPVSILIPCFNEELHVRDTIA